MCFPQDEDFTGFGTARVCPQKTVPNSSSFSHVKPPQASDQPSGTKPLIGKIIPKSPKGTLIGKIVPRLPREGQTCKESQLKVSDEHKEGLEQYGKQAAPNLKAQQANKDASGRKNDSMTKAGGSGCMKNQTAATSDEGTKQDKLAGALTAGKGKEKASKVRVEDGVSEDKGQVLPDKSMKRTRGFRPGHSRRTSQAVTLSFTSFHRRRRKKMAKDMGASPEIGAEAGAQSGPEAAMPLEGKSINSSEKRPYKRHQRKSLFGYRRKPQQNIKTLRSPKTCKRVTHTFYTYEPNPIPDAQSQVTSEEQNVPSFEDDPNSKTSARSSRIIKTPKRFLDEGMIPFPKGHLSTWLKTQQREEEKPSVLSHESGDGKSLESDRDPLSNVESPPVLSKFSPQPNPATSHVEIYKNLKKLTLKLAEKKKENLGTPGDDAQVTGLTSQVRKRRRSKLVMEEMDSPGVVRKLAVVVNNDMTEPSCAPPEDTANSSKSCLVIYLDKNCVLSAVNKGSWSIQRFYINGQHLLWNVFVVSS